MEGTADRERGKTRWGRESKMASNTSFYEFIPERRVVFSEAQGNHSILGRRKPNYRRTSGFTMLNQGHRVSGLTQWEVPDDSLLTLDTALRPGCMVAIRGGVDKYAKSFVINLRPSDSNDIALHLNAQVENHVFVRNSYINDSWGEEEKEIANFPFSPGMYLELIIFCEAHQFKVAVNGVHTLEYKHRFKQLEKINTVEILGDIKLLDVGLKRLKHLLKTVPPCQVQTAADSH